MGFRLYRALRVGIKLETSVGGRTPCTRHRHVVSFRRASRKRNITIFLEGESRKNVFYATWTWKRMRGATVIPCRVRSKGSTRFRAVFVDLRLTNGVTGHYGDKRDKKRRKKKESIIRVCVQESSVPEFALFFLFFSFS